MQSPGLSAPRCDRDPGAFVVLSSQHGVCTFAAKWSGKRHMGSRCLGWSWSRGLVYTQGGWETGAWIFVGGTNCWLTPLSSLLHQHDNCAFAFEWLALHNSFGVPQHCLSSNVRKEGFVPSHSGQGWGRTRDHRRMGWWGWQPKRCFHRGLHKYLRKTKETRNRQEKWKTLFLVKWERGRASGKYKFFTLGTFCWIHTKRNPLFGTAAGWASDREWSTSCFAGHVQF